MTTSLLKVENLCVRFSQDGAMQSVEGLNNISLHVNHNEVLGIIGESGSGKSITLLSILGLLSAKPGIVSGKITFSDNDNEINTLEDISNYIQVSDLGEESERIIEHKKWQSLLRQRYDSILGKRVSTIFQNPRLAFNPYYSIGKQISESIILHTNIEGKKINKNKAKEIAIDWLSKVKMEAPSMRYNNNPYGLSGGLCQRAMIAMALSSNPQLLIADEPTTGLDATIQGDILTLLEDLKKEKHLSMILVSHDLNVMNRLANRVLVYYKGNIIEQGDTNQVIDLSSSTHHPYTSLLLNTEFGNVIEDQDIKEDNNKAAEHLRIGCPFKTKCQGITDDIHERCISMLPPMTKVSGNHEIRCWKYHKA